jgi:hypothetical protein
MMKKKVFSVMATCCVLALVGAATVHAQMPGTALRATIPFDFSVRGKTLPAGEYEINRLSEGPEGLEIFSTNDKHERAIFETEPVVATKLSSKPQIVFHRYGDSYFLFEVFAGGGQTGRELPASRDERNLKREMASKNNWLQPETVTLAAY